MSPTIIFERGYQLTIFPNDHPPAHVHVRSAGNVARIKLDSVEVWDNYGYNVRQLRVIVALVDKHRDMLLRAWNEIHSEEP